MDSDNYTILKVTYFVSKSPSISTSLLTKVEANTYQFYYRKHEISYAMIVLDFCIEL